MTASDALLILMFGAGVVLGLVIAVTVFEITAAIGKNRQEKRDHDH